MVAPVAEPSVATAKVVAAVHAETMLAEAMAAGATAGGAAARDVTETGAVLPVGPLRAVVTGTVRPASFQHRSLNCGSMRA